MKRFLAITAIVAIVAIVAPLAFAQEAPKPDLNTENLVLEWLKRLNALADWDGKADTSALVDRFMELYDPAVLQFNGPNENQMGTVTYSGSAGVRHWADWFAHTHSKSEYRIQAQTQKMKTTGLLLAATPPWGGLGVAVEISAFYTNRESLKKFAAPGAAFFVFTPAGKINRMRLYLLEDETGEIFP